MTEIVDLALKRMQRSGDSRDWTPLDALKDLIRDIEEGRLNPTRLACHYETELPEGGAACGFVVANCTRHEHLSLLAVAQHKALQDFCGG